jgi:hypothetical protein
VSGVAQLAVWCLLLAFVALGELVRWSNPDQRAIAWTLWVCGPQADWLPFVPWLLSAPLLWGIRRRSRPVASDRPLADAPLRSAGWLAVACSALSFAVNAWTGSRFGDLPPAYHDEFSYLFQAKTFLDGRVSYPSFEPLPELFDQMHVLNEGRFASRYFPGAGLWLAPFVAAGHPYLGYWLAGALATMFVFWSGWEIGGRTTAVMAGLLTALSPGLALFSNLLLAHHPTLVGLTLFTWMYLRAQRTGQLRDHLLGACGLTFAMLCRPMTAFGIGLPFGILLLWQLLRPHPQTGDSKPWTLQRRGLIVMAWGIPLLAGLSGMLAYNAAITGKASVSPYQLYTDTYTPRHVYGFHNVTRGEQHLGPKVLENYDIWAEELTPALAVRNIGRRISASFRWTLGIVPITAALLILLLSRATWNRGVLLIVATVVSLHAVHIPYWFEGIMGWHYVFESAPLLLLLVAEATRQLSTTWSQTGHPILKWWWRAVLITAVAVNLISVPLQWPGRIAVGISELAFPRHKYDGFFSAARELAAGQPTIVFVEPDPSDRHIDYVVNDPALTGPLIIARYRPDRVDLQQARTLFPDRQAFLFRAATGQWRKLP